MEVTEQSAGAEMKRFDENAESNAAEQSVDQTARKKLNATNESSGDVADDSAPKAQYAASYLKTGTARGVTYQIKILTWVAWKLTNSVIDKWWLATEVSAARGFHDLVLKCADNTSNGKCVYRFVQMKHRTRLSHKTNVTINHLMSNKVEERQYSLIYLFKSYLNMIDTYEGITEDQIVDLTVFTNRNMNGLRFFVPVEKDGLFDFEGRGKRYRVDVEAFQKDGIMMCIRQMRHPRTLVRVSDTSILNFLKKLVFAVDQPSEWELEKLIVGEMGKIYKFPQIVYNDFYKNIMEWFLVYDNGKAPYLTEGHAMRYVKNLQDTLLDVKKTETIFITDQVSKLTVKMKSLSM